MWLAKEDKVYMKAFNIVRKDRAALVVGLLLSSRMD
jgi:hypothetical protein